MIYSTVMHNPLPDLALFAHEFNIDPCYDCCITFYCMAIFGSLNVSQIYIYHMSCPFVLLLMQQKVIIITLLGDYEEALKEGEDDVAYTRVMFLGKEGSGKTSLLDGIMGLPFKKGRDSTSLAESRDVKYEWVEAEGGEGWGVWRERSKEDEVNELAIRSQRVAQINAEAQDGTYYWFTDSEGADELSDSLECTDDSLEGTDDQSGSQDPTFNEAVTTNEIQSISETYKEHTDDICAKARDLEEHMSSKENPDVLHVWDCGGQPIFLDILSVFITMHTFFFLVFDAAEDIHAPCKGSVWRHKGRKIQGRKRNISVIQLLVQWMQLIYALVGSSSSTRNVMLVGTHGDKLREREGVLKLLDSACSEKSFYQIVLKHLIIDNTTSGWKRGEDRGYGVIREEISKFSKTQITRTPLRWISFRSVIMIHNVDSVLDFYHQLGVFLYFRETCPDTVFVDPHWLFQSMCVLLMPQCYNELDLDIPPALQTYVEDYGIMSNDIYEVASKKCGLQADDLIKILDHFDLAKELPTQVVINALRGMTGSKFFFVPCTLKNVIDQDYIHIVFKYLGCVAPGFFIRLAALMARRDNFELHLKSDRGVYRDCIPFKYNRTLEVTIFEPPSIESIHIDVAIHNSLEDTLAHSCFSLCNEIYTLCKENTQRWLPSIDVGLAFKCEECSNESKTYFKHIIIPMENVTKQCIVCESCTRPLSDSKQYNCWLTPAEVCFNVYTNTAGFMHELYGLM